MVRKKKNYTAHILIGILILFILGMYLGIIDFDKLAIRGDSLKDGVLAMNLDNQALTTPLNDYLGYCTLSLTPTSICKGEFVTGTLVDGANTNCYIFANDGSGWRNVLSGRTNSAGVWTDTNRIDVVGNFQFVGVCDKDSSNSLTFGDCITNFAYLEVKDCTPSATTEYYCCYAMGMTSCYEGGCPSAGVQISGPYSTLSQCNSACSSSSEPTTYTCGQGADQYSCGGTCPVGYSCYELWGDFYSWCACASGPIQEGGTGEIHPDWKPNGQYFNPFNGDEFNGEGDFAYECTQDDECSAGFCKDGSCHKYALCEDIDGRDFFTASYIIVTGESGVTKEYYDECNGNYLHERLCTIQGDAPTGFHPDCTSYGPTWGCYMGRCMEII